MLHRPAASINMLVLLRAVSRSFDVSIRLLPVSLRRPIAVAYLLARAADTFADTPGLSPADRKLKLRTWAAAIEGQVPASDVLVLSASCASLQQDHAEGQLMMALPQCLIWLDELPSADREDVRTVLRHITRGQALDVERFNDTAVPRALESSEQLDEYTYLVAGSVGEFWTELCFRHLPAFATLGRSEMRELGRSYGMALQLVNILRDAGPDLALGRCYFPAPELAESEVTPSDILSSPERFEPVWRGWEAKARGGLASGMVYANAVRSRRVRAASALPALLAARTLALLRAAGPQRLQRKVKMPRSEVRNVLARLAITLAARSPMKAMYGRLGWDNPNP